MNNMHYVLQKRRLKQYFYKVQGALWGKLECLQEYLSWYWETKAQVCQNTIKFSLLFRCLITFLYHIVTWQKCQLQLENIHVRNNVL